MYTDNGMETDSAATKENNVLQQLLRKPRYFNPAIDSWVTCSWCGQEGHRAGQCTMQKRRKPCLRCGSSWHRRCRQRRKAKRNREIESHPDSCLRCGGPGHDMFSCSSDYSPDDLKEIQCYICKKFGHLCCQEFPDLCSSEISCYECGESGHLGSGCPSLSDGTSGSKPLSGATVVESKAIKQLDAIIT
ncbi:uncharacterized protein LOC126676435 [Mercurialis annua]|uniref:uncharacterized protein LOC126676435 n=1 Tax=Mercurialis annua TaxID=3986 RepID=UPI00215FF470|nr:uncharacterized protein LOC126676435 [Mercurialis annua]XP_050226600.1 uncharacterized protein LOC126676435 [Mercurialis annua]XP_055961629.1 uncharacterized protein LOC126676435 [Mercurialis annua]